MSSHAYNAQYDSYFGICPCCAYDGRFYEGQWLNVHKTHWVVCHEHEVRWCVGENLSDSWRDESEDVWDDNARLIEPYREIAIRFVQEFPPLFEERKALAELLDSLPDLGFPEEEVPF